MVYMTEFKASTLKGKFGLPGSDGAWRNLVRWRLGAAGRLAGAADLVGVAEQQIGLQVAASGGRFLIFFNVCVSNRFLFFSLRVRWEVECVCVCYLWLLSVEEGRRLLVLRC